MLDLLRKKAQSPLIQGIILIIALVFIFWGVGGYRGTRNSVAQVNDDVISYEDLLVVFMTSHDPTTLNRQGGDMGTQYRSVIYYHDNAQKEIVTIVSKEVAAYFENPIVTEISPLGTFYEAEDNHQDYYRNNTAQGYCSAVITPKLAKLRKMHADKLKGVSA